MAKLWEVFDPTTGGAIMRTRFKLWAAFWAWALLADYAREGEGYILPRE
jgi:hypothetical protein